MNTGLRNQDTTLKPAKQNIIKMMSKEEYHTGLDTIISKFENGQQRFRESALFNFCIHQLVKGVDPIDIIDKLITSNESTTEKFKEYLTINPPRIIIPKEDEK